MFLNYGYRCFYIYYRKIYLFDGRFLGIGYLVNRRRYFVFREFIFYGGFDCVRRLFFDEELYYYRVVYVFLKNNIFYFEGDFFFC